MSEACLCECINVCTCPRRRKLPLLAREALDDSTQLVTAVDRIQARRYVCFFEGLKPSKFQGLAQRLP